MDSSCGIRRMKNLAQQLRSYKPPPSQDSDGEQEEQKKKVVFAESTVSIRRQPKYGSKRAAVLVCLFESEAGDLRVILTKRASHLTNHPVERGPLLCSTSSSVRRLMKQKARIVLSRIILGPICRKCSSSVEDWVVPRAGIGWWILFDFNGLCCPPSSLIITGEISLPGGMVDGGDADDCQAALREAKEEIGLDPSLVEVVTVLQPFLSMQLNKVTPVIGMLFNKRAFEPVINTTEVEAVFDAPLEMFLKDENHRTEVHKWMGVMYRLHFFDFQAGNEKYVIWGITSGILIRAASVVYQRLPPFDEQKPYFKIGNL